LRNITYSYEVHEKLQNFMVPVAAHTSWHEEQIDELFTSLLGKGLENAGMLDGESEVAEMDGEAQRRVDESMQEGFRVFG
jgi:protein AATF/BFR2